MLPRVVNSATNHSAQRTGSQTIFNNPAYLVVCVVVEAKDPKMSLARYPPVLGNINEICLVTPNIYETMDGLQPLGIGHFTVYRFDSNTVTNRQLNGEAADFELLVAFARQNELVVELMQPLNGTNSMMAAYLQANGCVSGIQHVAFDMGNVPMDERIKIMHERGFKIGMEGIWHGKKGQCRFVYFDTASKGAGTCFETIEFSKDWEEPEGELYPRKEGQQ